MAISLDPNHQLAKKYSSWVIKWLGVASEWFTESGERGTVVIEPDGEDWVLSDPDLSKRVVVSLPEGVQPELRGPKQVTATVGLFTYIEESKHRLYLDYPIEITDVDEASGTSSGPDESDGAQQSEGDNLTVKSDQEEQSSESPSMISSSGTTNEPCGWTDSKTGSSVSGREELTPRPATDSGGTKSSKATQNATGTVEEVSEDGDYGFITTTDIGRRAPDGSRKSEDIFVHVSAVPTSTIELGWRLQFDIKQTNKGFEAKNVKIISKETHRRGQTTTVESHNNRE